MQRWRARKPLKLLVAASANLHGIFGTISGAETSTTCCPPTTRGIGMSLWIVLCGLLIVTLSRNMGRPVLSTGVGAPFPTARRDQGDPALNRPHINPR